jgi:membrane protein required for colicin V production
MNFIDIVFTALLGYALFTGLKNGLFVEIASFGSLIIGIFVAIKFSHIIRLALEDSIKVNPKYIEFVAFAITFLLVVVGIYLLAKFFTSISSLAYLGWLNKLGGAVFSVLKTILMLSVVISLFQKININHILVKEETLNNSIFYNPIQEVSKFMYPSLEKWYEEFKEKAKSESDEEEVSDSSSVIENN